MHQRCARAVSYSTELEPEKKKKKTRKKMKNQYLQYPKLGIKLDSFPKNLQRNRKQSSATMPKIDVVLSVSITKYPLAIERIFVR
jgi:ethanolamine ammonia-lyase small subunit